MSEDEAAQLPAWSGHGVPAPRQLKLPGFAPLVPGCPSWLLWMFDTAGGESMAQGRGAPWPMRLFVGALLHLPIGDRDGHWRTLQLPVEEVIAWLHPNGWANRRRDWERFPAALDAMRDRLTYVPVPGFGSVAIMFPSVIPRVPSDPLVEFTLHIPASAAHGARIDWQRALPVRDRVCDPVSSVPERVRLPRPVGAGRASDHGGNRCPDTAS